MNDPRKTMNTTPSDQESTAGDSDADQPNDGAAAETADAEPRGGIDASQGSRGGSPLGSQTGRTGMGDDQPAGSSQGLAGAQGSGGGADRGPPGSIGGGPAPD